jgi:hypothetical protein
MAAPEYVPVLPQDRPRRAEELPPAERWVADRPGDFVIEKADQPVGRHLGTPGPDQGYALKLARLFEDRLHLAGEHHEDAVAGCLGVATRRAALFGRAPVVYDLELAFALWGFLDASPPADLVAFRKPLFESARHHYWDQRAISDRVPDATLRLTPDQVKAQLTDWKSLLITI